MFDRDRYSPDQLAAAASEKRKEREYWIKKLSGGIVTSIFPYDYREGEKGAAPRQRLMKCIPFEVSPELVPGLIKLSKESHQTLYVILAAGLVLLLGKYSGQKDIIIGSPIFKQDNQRSLINKVLVLRTLIEEDMTVKELLLKVKQTIIEALENRNYPLEILIKQLGLSGPGLRDDFPLFDTAILLENIHNKNDIHHIGTNINFSFLKNHRGITAQLEFNRFLYRDDTIERISHHFNTALEQALLNLNAKVSDIDILTDEEKKQLLVEFNDTRRDYPKDKIIHELFEEQVRRTPDSVAVMGGEQRDDVFVTYRELNRKSNRLARVLRDKGVKSDTVVGIMLDRSIEMITGILAILKAGGAYLPINVESPGKRVKYMLEDGNAPVVLTKSSMIKNYSFVPEEEKHREKCTCEIILLDEIRDILSGKCGENLALRGQARDLAYTMFTSGSTGQPKAVLVEHRNIVRLVKNTDFVTLNEGDHLLQTAPLEFDASTIEIWGSLLNGLSFYLTIEENILNPEDIKAFIRKYDIITMWMTSPLFNQMLEADIGIFSGLKNIIIGGDALSPAHINRLKRKYPRLNVINGYGPTENTTFSTTYLIDREYNGSIPIGKPIANSTAYILDRNNHLVPMGVPGELCVGGDGVSRGYLNNPEFTRQKYITNPFVEGDILYRTGDNARWLPDRSIEFLGRMDHQVKIRGIRMELGEIENQILHHPQVREAVVLAKQDKNKDKYLCAYVVLKEKQDSMGKAIDLSGLKKELAVNLPDYMIPSHFIRLPEIPLTQNGKVDRNALPDPEIAAGKDHLPPRNELEKKLAAIWADVLNVDEEAIGIHSNFFDLGGHSLKATVLISVIFKELNVKIPLPELFINQTIMELAQYIEGSKQDKFFSIESVEEKEYYELSSAQKRLYILQQLDLASTAYNIPETFYLPEDLDIHRLESTFAKLVQRHQALRASIEIVDKKAVQKIHQNVEFQIEYCEVKNSASGINDEELYADIIGEFVRPFDLGNPPLFRVGLITAEEENILLVDMHHIISDGTSHDVLIKEFRGIYEGKELPELRLQYKDYAEWQHSKEQREIIKKQEEYWLTEFSGELPVLNLPTDYPRPAAQSFEGAAVDFTLNRAETQIIKKIAKATDATLYMVMLSIFNILLAKLAGQEDIIVGTPIAARRHADLQRIIGMFVNTLTLRHFPTGDRTFKEFLENVKTRTLQAFENQEYQFEDLVDNVIIQRDPSRNPVFDIMFNLLNQAEYSKEGLYNRQKEKEKEDFLHKKCMSKFDLTLTAADLQETINCTIIYSTKLFKPETIETFIKYFRNIVSALSSTIEQRIADIEITAKEEKNRLVYEFNRPQTEFPGDKTIHQLFEEQVERTPEKAALVGGRQYAVNRLTYKELNARSNQLARVLRPRGIKPGTIAAIMAAPSVEMIIGILAVLKAGGAFLPIDPNYPVERRKYLFDDAGVDILLSQKEYIDPSGNEYHVIDLGSEDMYTGNRDNLEWNNSAADPVYVIYTSGSTGRPKGVLLKHENLVNYVDWFSKEADLSSADKTMLTSSFAFDLGYTSISTSILNGGQLHLLEKEMYLSPENVINYIKDNRITYVKMTPSLFTIIVNSDSFRKPMVEPLRLIVLGGEEIKPDDVERARGICNHIRIMNHYGPTEATIGCIAQFIDFHDFDEYKNKPTIGKPINNTNVFILDRYLKLQPIGVPGELLISGVSVAGGYLNRPELTAEKFLYVSYRSYSTYSSKKSYKTGDLARWQADENIEFLGRIDHQVKIRGYRIEPGEIENRLANLKNIKEAAVLVKEDKSGDKYLCAYVISKTPVGNGAVDFSEIKKALLKNLPDYMIPSCFVELEKMPLTPNGKINRKALPEPEIGAAPDFIAPFTPLGKKLAEIWADVLGINKEIIGVEANFFELGGHSLKATILAAKIDKQLNVKVPLVEIFKTPTITGLSKYIREVGKSERAKRIDDEKLVLLRRGIDTESHIFFIHDATGEVEGYIELCNYFKSDFNCWGIRADRLKNLTPRNITINRIAGEYIKSIKKVQAAGPYHIVGWSLGGIIAYEIVRQLEEQHGLIGFFAMIDTYAVVKDAAAKAPGFSVDTEVDFMQNVWGEQGINKQLKNETEPEGIWVKVVDYLESHKNRQKIIDNIIIKYNLHRVLPNIGQLSLKDKIHHINVMRSLHNARMQYRPPGKITTLIHFFEADNTFQNIAVEQIPWNDFSSESIKTYKLPGDHYSILTGPEAVNLANLLGGAINLN